MREIRTSGSEGGEAEPNRPSLPLSVCPPKSVPALARKQAPLPASRRGAAGQRGPTSSRILSCRRLFAGVFLPASFCAFGGGSGGRFSPLGPFLFLLLFSSS